MAVQKTGYAVGINRGYVTKKIDLPAKPSNKRGVTSRRTQFVRNLIRETVGFCPYERRIMELLKNNKDKKAKKFAKKRLGTLVRAKKKVDEMTRIIAESKRAH